MSMRYQAGIVLPGYNALKVANAPTIGTATAGASQVSVAFTAPSCVGGGAITSYTAYCTTTGTKTASGASSPLVVTGLTNGTAYTFKVFATNAYGPSYPSAASNSATPNVVGQQAYTTPGSYSWVAPASVTSVSVVAVGAGGNNYYYYPAAGGGLGYKNNITVTPGNSYTVQVGDQNQDSYFINCTTVAGKAPVDSPYKAVGGTYVGDGGGNGGDSNYRINERQPYGGGGAGGYAGNGGGGAYTSSVPPYTNQPSGANGAGGGGGGGGGTTWGGGGGGGVGILGQGSNGVGGGTGSTSNGYNVSSGGGGGSGGASGQAQSYTFCFPCGTPLASTPGTGGSYGGGAGKNGQYPNAVNALAGTGAVRIIYPGTTRSFPSTCTGNL